MSEYWIGPHGMRISKNVKCVVSEDGYNSCMFLAEGLIADTQKYMMDAITPTKGEYLAKYAELRADGYYYYKEQNQNK